MRLLLIVNPWATNVTSQRRTTVEEQLHSAHDVTVATTTHRGHAGELVSRLAVGHDVVVVLAGDGTLNEAAAALVELRDGDLDGDTPALPALAPLPGGGTNVVARTLGVPHRLDDAVSALLRSLEAGSIERVGVGSVDGRAFLFHTGVGWDAALVEVVERHERLKRRFGHALFVYAGLRTFFGGFDRRHPHFSVHFDDGETVPDGFFAVVMNTDPYTFVGRRPFTIAPGTTLHGPLTVVVLTSMRIRRFLPLLIDALGNRSGVRERPWLRVRTGVDHVEMRRITEPAGATMPRQVDGDDLGEADALEFRHLPEAIDLVVPVPG